MSLSFTSATSLNVIIAEVLKACSDVYRAAYENDDADISDIEVILKSLSDQKFMLTFLKVFISYQIQSVLAFIYEFICRLFYRLSEKK